MVSKLLSFARKDSLSLAPVDLNSVVSVTVELLARALADRGTKIHLELDRNIPSVMGDSIHLEQVIANIVLNAVDAMPGGGKITITTSQAVAGSDASMGSSSLMNGRQVSLAIQDTGTGIPAAIRDRIFDPFFTTKPAGKGTGLGLAMVYGIVKSHAGSIQVESEEGKGTVFTISLPSAEKSADRLKRPAKAFPMRSKGRWESILIVEDERDVLSYVGDVLDHHGYLVFLAEDVIHARYLFDRLGTEIDLVITDVVMPIMNGVDLARSFKEMRPAVKVIGISGHDGGAVIQGERSFDSFMKKPFDGTALVSTVRRVLDDRKDVMPSGNSAPEQ